MPHATRIKMCGMTSAEDIACAVDAGADAIGIIVAPSARRVASSQIAALIEAVPPFVTPAIVTAGDVDVDLAALARGGVVLQFSGDETVAVCEGYSAGRTYLRAFHLPPAATTADLDGADVDAHPHALPLFDTRVDGAHGGTGQTFIWSVLAALANARRIVVSGGLTADNVAACIAAVRPYAVDVRSGVETNGRKDPAKMHAFVRAVRAADRAHGIVQGR